MIWLDNARVIALVAVVALHVAAPVVAGSDIGSDAWWFGNLYNSLVRWCVPVFVMISGALLLDPKKQESPRTFYRKRLSKILIPIFFWTAFFLCWTFLKGFLRGNPPAAGDILQKLVSGNAYYHMWFLYMILGLYLFTPFFRKIVAHSTASELWWLVLFSFLVAAASYAHWKLILTGPRCIVDRFAYFIPAFFLGYLIRIDSRAPPKPLLWSLFFVSVAASSVGCYTLGSNRGLFDGLYFYGFSSVPVILMSVSAIYLLRSLKQPILPVPILGRLSVLTFGIYLIHPAVLDAMTFMGVGPTSFHPAFSIPAVTLAISTASLAGAWVLSELPYFRRTIGISRASRPEPAALAPPPVTDSPAAQVRRDGVHEPLRKSEPASERNSRR